MCYAGKIAADAAEPGSQPLAPPRAVVRDGGVLKSTEIPSSGIWAGRGAGPTSEDSRRGLGVHNDPVFVVFNRLCIDFDHDVVV